MIPTSENCEEFVTERNGPCRKCRKMANLFDWQKWKRKLTNSGLRKIPFFILFISALQVMIYCAADEKLKRILPYHTESKAEIWRFLSYMLLHTSVLHLTLNVVIQGLLGTPLELEQGWLRCSVVYFGGGLAGSLGASAFATFSSMVGGSGGVYALLSSHIPNVVLNYQTIKYAAHRTAAIAALVASDVIYLLCHVYFYNNERPRIGWVAHASGAAAGLLLGFLFFRGTSKWKKKLRMTSCLILALPSMSAVAFSLTTYTLRLLNSYFLSMELNFGFRSLIIRRREVDLNKKRRQFIMKRRLRLSRR